MDKTYSLCEGTISLGRPVRSEKVRVPFKKSRTVYIYICPTCKGERRMYANSFRGTRPEPGVGAFVCGAYLPQEKAVA